MIPLVLVLLLAGCYPTGVEPTQVDTDRLATLSEEPLLAGGRPSPAEANNTSANANAKRAHIDTTQSWSDVGTGGTWTAAQEFLAELRAEGWVVVLQNCRASSGGFNSGDVVALKELDGFTAGMLASIDPDGASLTAYAPFHEESTNPWGPVVEQKDGCLDSPEEPTTTTISNTRTTVNVFYLRDE